MMNLMTTKAFENGFIIFLYFLPVFTIGFEIIRRKKYIKNTRKEVPY